MFEKLAQFLLENTVNYKIGIDSKTNDKKAWKNRKSEGCRLLYFSHVTMMLFPRSYCIPQGGKGVTQCMTEIPKCFGFDFRPKFRFGKSLIAIRERDQLILFFKY